MARKSDKLVVRNKFFIITNGEQTEYNYFTLLKAKRSVYDVKVIFENADPLGLVQYAQRFVLEANQVWCVFDIDDTYKDKRLVPALKQAEENGIKVAYSNVAFEVWLISHFEKCKPTLQLKDYAHELDRLLKENGKNLTYSKNDEKLLKTCFIPNYKKAMENAKILNQTYVKEHNAKYPNQRQPIWNWISSTTVYKLVEALNLRD
ncbi:MAG: RloB family protein [Turicibacter sp.]|nr:RloB family protein [Turicibacter sp.]